MNTETGGAGGGASNGLPGAADTLPIPTMSRVRSMSDEITIYEITAPIPSKPTLKPLNFDIDLFKGSPTKLSPQKLSPLSSGSQNTKILSPARSIISPKRESHSPSELTMSQLMHSPSKQSVMLIPFKPELTVTVVSPNSLVDTNSTTKIQSIQSPLPHTSISLVSSLSHRNEEQIIEVEEESNSLESIQSEEKSNGRKKRRRRIFTPHIQKSMYRTRTVVKAQNEKEHLAAQRAKNEVPLIKPAPRDTESPPLAFGTRGRKRNQRKLSTAEQLEQIKLDGSIDLQTPGSILKLINLKNILTRRNFAQLPPMYQFKLLQLLPDVDSVSEGGKPTQPSEDGFDNLFYNKACEDWRSRLIAGDFTPEQKLKQKMEIEKDRLKVDSWKIKHFEPIWGETYEAQKPSPSKQMTKGSEKILGSATSSSKNLANKNCESKVMEPSSPTLLSSPINVVLLKEEIETESPNSQGHDDEVDAKEEVNTEDTTILIPQETKSDSPMEISEEFPTPVRSPISIKRDSSHLDKEDGVESKRKCFCYFGPILYMTKRDQDGSKTSERICATCHSPVVDVANSELVIANEAEVDEEENDLLCRSNELPIVLDVGNEVTIGESPPTTLSSVSSPSLKADTPETENLEKDGTHSEPDIMQIAQEPNTSKSISEVEIKTEEILKIEVKAEGENDFDGDSVYSVEIIEQLSLPSEMEDQGFLEQQVHLESGESESQELKIELCGSRPENSPIQSSDLTENVPPPHVKNLSIQSSELTENVPPPPVKLELISERVIDLSPSPPTIPSSVGFTESSIQIELAGSISPKPTTTSSNQSFQFSSLVTPSIRLPISSSSSSPQPNLIKLERPTQQVVLRMLSLSGPNNTIQGTPLRLVGTASQPPPPISSTSIVPIPIIVKPVTAGGKTESLRNLTPGMLSEFVPVSPRNILRVTSDVSSVLRPTQSQSMVPLPSIARMTGPTPIIPNSLGGMSMSPSSPATNVSSSPLNIKKNSRQKPRQTRPKSTIMPPGTVNLDRSYQIVNAVIQNSPNREQLQKQIIKPPPLTQNNNRNGVESTSRPESSIEQSIGGNTLLSSCRKPINQTTLIQATSSANSCSGALPLLSGVGPTQKLMVVNQGITPLLRPVQQHQGLSHQIVVSSSSNGTTSAVGQGQRGLGMNVTFTSKHNPTTNNNTPSVIPSPAATTFITPQHLAILIQQQQQQQQHSNSTNPIQRPPQALPQCRSSQRPSIFISRSTPQTHPQSNTAVKIIHPTQFFNQPNRNQILHLQAPHTTRAITSQSQSDVGGQIPVRAQIVTPTGETLTIHRAGVQPVRVSSIRSAVHTINMDYGKRGNLQTTTPPLGVMNRPNLPDNLVQTIVSNSTAAASPPPSSNLLSPMPNLTEFFTSHLAATNIRPLSPLAFETLPSERNQIRMVPTSTAIPHALDTATSVASSSVILGTNTNPSHHQPSQVSIFSSTPQSQQSLSDLVPETSSTLFDLHDALGENSSFSIIHDPSTSSSNPPTEFLNLDGHENRDMLPVSPVLQPQSNNPSHPPGYTVSNQRQLDGNILVQNTRLDTSLPENTRTPYVILFQTTGSNGIVQNIVSPASVLMPSSDMMKDDVVKIEEVGPPRAASAPLPNQGPTALILNQSQTHHHHHPSTVVVQDQKQQPPHLPVNFQDYQGVRLMYKDENQGRTNELNGIQYNVTSASPTSYTITPVSSSGAQNMVRMMTRTSSPDIWTYTHSGGPLIPPNGHIVNVNLNGSSGSARIIPGQHPVISIPDTTNGSSSGTGLPGDFDIFNSITTGSGNGEAATIKLEDGGGNHSIIIPVSVNNNRPPFQPQGGNIGGHQSQSGQGNGSNVVLGTSPGNCVCDLRALISCPKCGGFSHNDCRERGTELCMDCMIR